MKFHFNQVIFLLVVCTAFFSQISGDGGGLGDMGGSGTDSPNTTQAMQGSTQALPPPIRNGMRLCVYFDSRTPDSRRRYCSLQSSCFSYIYRGIEGYRIKRGCNYNCQNDTRRKKIQKCCDSHLCNTHHLSEDNFNTLTTPPPPQCYQSDTNSTCNMTTSCYTRLTYRSNGMFYWRQGCIRRKTCNESSTGNTIQQCCTTHLCNPPIPISTHPRSSATPTFVPTQQMSTLISETPPSTSTFTPPRIRPGYSEDTSATPPIDHTSLLECHCDVCGSGPICRGYMCAYVVYNLTQVAMTDRTCFNDSSTCHDTTSDLYPGAYIACCNSNLCNVKLPQIITTAITMDTTTPTHTTPHPNNATDMNFTSALVTKATVPLSLVSDEYFTIASVGSVIGGIIVVGIILSIMVILIVQHQRKNKARQSSVSPQQPSHDCHVPVCYSKTTRGSPCMTSSSDNSLQSADILKQLGTSV